MTGLSAKIRRAPQRAPAITASKRPKTQASAEIWGDLLPADVRSPGNYNSNSGDVVKAVTLICIDDGEWLPLAGSKGVPLSPGQKAETKIVVTNSAGRTRTFPGGAVTIQRQPLLGGATY